MSHLDNVVDIITSSPKRVSVLHEAQRLEIQNLLSAGELESGRGANQICNLQRAGATRWSSHYNSVKSLTNIYGATCKGIMRVTDSLCQIFQRKIQDILAAIAFVSSTKTMLQELRECGWEEFLEKLEVFCMNNGIDVPNLDSPYKVDRSRGLTIVKHHYRYDIFNEVINCILMELNSRSNDTSMELLSLSVNLDPKNHFISFNSDDICKLAWKFYHEDFTDQDIVSLKYELRHFQHDTIGMQEFQVSMLVELSELLTKTGRSKVYVMLTRLIHRILTLHISTATTERTFSGMKLVKTALLNKMEMNYLKIH